MNREAIELEISELEERKAKYLRRAGSINRKLTPLYLIKDHFEEFCALLEQEKSIIKEEPNAPDRKGNNKTT